MLITSHSILRPVAAMPRNCPVCVASTGAHERLVRPRRHRQGRPSVRVPVCRPSRERRGQHQRPGHGRADLTSRHWRPITLRARGNPSCSPVRVWPCLSAARAHRAVQPSEYLGTRLPLAVRGQQPFHPGIQAALRLDIHRVCLHDRAEVDEARGSTRGRPGSVTLSVTWEWSTPPISGPTCCLAFMASHRFRRLFGLSRN
jgi:hypothetical protein